MRPESDSGGSPWAGRELPPAPYAGDDGRPDPALAAALASAGSAADRAVAVTDALRAARVFVAVVTLPGAATEMALLTVQRPDGRRSLPVFSGPERLAAWRPDARPVPVDGRRAALSAVAEGCELLHVDPDAPAEHLVARPAVWAVAEDRPWRPSYVNPAVAQEVSRLLRDLALVGRCEEGQSAELRVVLGLPPGLAAEQVRDLTERFTHRLGTSEIVAQDVDSMEIVVRPV